WVLRGGLRVAPFSLEMPMVKAIALVGFYRGELVKPGDIVELADPEFAELRAFNKVDFAPAKVEEKPRGK
ncbi:MAG: hypothetical protein RLZZ524_558, partial [Pseudomonadota bacterium]